MTAQEAREYAKAAIQKLVDSGRADYDKRYCIGQAAGMVKAFRAAGLIEGDVFDLLDELEDIILGSEK